MSDDTASFEVHLRDRVSRDAASAARGFREVHRAAEGRGVEKGTKALGRTEKTLKRTERTVRSLGKTTKKVNPFGEFGANTKHLRSPAHVAKMWDGLAAGHKKYAAQLKTGGGGGGMLGMLGGGPATAALAGTAVAGYAAFETGRAALSAVKYRDEVLTGLKLITGSASEANRVFEDSIKLSDRLGQDWRTTVGGMQKLLGKGFTEDFARDLTGGIADLSIVAPDANVDNLLLAIGQIKTAGKLQGDELNQLTEAGLNSSLMFQELEKRLGKSHAEVMKLKEQGGLLADDVLPAILSSIQQLTGKELGQAAEEANKTTAGVMRKLEQLPGRFFLGVAKELDKSGLEGALNDILDALDPDSEAFASGVQNVAKAINFAAEGAQVAIPLLQEFGAGIEEAAQLAMGIETPGEFFDHWKDPETLASVREFGKNLGIIAGAMAKIIELSAKFGGAVVSSGGPVSAVEDALIAKAQESWSIAKDVTGGLINGLLADKPAVFNASAQVGDAMISGMKSRGGADVHSPSRKAFAVGGFVDKGAALGMKAEKKAVLSAGSEVGKASVQGIGVGAGLNAGNSGVSLNHSALPMSAGSAQRLPDISSRPSGSPASTSGMSIGDVILNLEGLGADVTKSPEALARAVRRELESFFDGLAQQGTIQ